MVLVGTFLIVGSQGQKFQLEILVRAYKGQGGDWQVATLTPIIFLDSQEGVMGALLSLDLVLSWAFLDLGINCGGLVIVRAMIQERGVDCSESHS